MSKFKIKMKLQGLELEIEGTREDINLINQNLGQQMAGLLQPAGAIIEGQILDHPKAPYEYAQPKIEEVRKKSRRKRQTPASGAAADAISAVDWKHDSAKYGAPQQSWSTSQKALWTLYVVNEAANITELSSQVIIATFNKQFRPAGEIRIQHVRRDLGKLKVKKGVPPVGEDTTKSPAVWFLTDEGKKQAQKLITESITSKS